MSEPAKALRVLQTVGASWRFLLTHPGAALRTAWLPLGLIVWLSLPDDRPRGWQDAGAALADLMTAGAVLALLILAMVAWQRAVLFGAGHRQGLSALRLGRAELLSILHFPLVEVLFVPLQLWPLAVWLASAPAAFGGGPATWMPWIAFAVIVFPGGPYLARATLMLAAIAAAGGQRISLTGTANRAWSAGAGNTLRLYLTVMLAGLPIAAAAVMLNELDPAGGAVAQHLAVATLRGALLLTYMLVVAGALAHAWQSLTRMDNPAVLPQSHAR